MGLALRMQSKVEYLDFNRIHNETKELKKRCMNAQVTVQKHQVAKQTNQTQGPALVMKNDWKIDKSKIKSSIP